MLRRAYQIDPGTLRNLQIREVELPDPAPDEVQISVQAIGLNFADLYTIWGMYKAAPKADFIPGLEYSGVVAKVGSDVTQWSSGDRIMGVTRFGAYTDHLNIDARYITPLPDGWSLEEGAGYLVQVLTAYYGLIELGRLKKGETVLIHSAAGGVGIQANRIAKRLGAYTIGTVGSERKLALLEKEGCDEGIVRTGDFRQDLKNALGDRPLNVVMESVGGRILMDGFKALTAEGRMIVYGNASFTTHGDSPDKLKMLWRYLQRPKIDPLLLPNANKSIMGFNLIWLYGDSARLHRILGELKALDMPPPFIGETYAFDQLADAIRRLQSGQTVGKVVVVI